MSELSMSTSPGFDVIGDVHGMGGHLVGLLDVLGYSLTDGVWKHPSRRVIFVGDLIDRGPDQKIVLETARRMCDAGTALIVAGNHEFNALGYATVDSQAEDGQTLRPSRGDGKKAGKNREQHEAFVSQLTDKEREDALDWFSTFPLWLDLGDLRVVHACWDDQAVAGFEGRNVLSNDLVEAAHRKGSDEHRWVEHLLKGPEVEIDPSYLDKGRHRRDHARMKWWDSEASSLRKAAHIPPDTTTIDGDPYPELPETPAVCPVAPYTSAVPVIFGHYWMNAKTEPDERPVVRSSKTACVDYSAAKGGLLTAYRWCDGDTDLSSDRLVSYG